MWLLNTTTRTLHYFLENVPDYVILSHTWREGEVTFDDIGKPHAHEMLGYYKIMRCCEKALQDGFDWAWVDTCCIDKRSSAELSEAINSMYKWYWDAAICYAYMADVPAKSLTAKWKRTFESSRWFKRGWTLQELLAPDTVEFYDETWEFIGTKSSHLESVHAATQIDVRYILNRESIKHASIAAKLSWASSRETTRKEDMAYCLLGLVQVNMPMLYGEGDSAFYRLQLELVKQTNEHTIFAWETNHESEHHLSMFAPSPRYFATAAQIRSTVSRSDLTASHTHEVTNNGLNITLPCISIDQSRVVAILQCVTQMDSRVGVWLERLDDGRYRRLSGARVTIGAEEMDDASPTPMYIVMDSRPSGNKHGQALQMKIGNLHPRLQASIVTMGNMEHKDFSFKLASGMTSYEEVALYLRNDFMLRDGEVANISFYDVNRAELGCGLKYGRPWLKIIDPRRYIFIDDLRNEFDKEAQALLRSDDSPHNFRDQVRLSCLKWVSEKDSVDGLEKDVDAQPRYDPDGTLSWKHKFEVDIRARKIRENGILWWVLDIGTRDR